MGKQWNKVSDFIFLGSNITADGDCSHEIKRCLLLGRKAMTLSILKSRDVTLLIKICIVKAIVFPIDMYRCERWTIKKDECQRLDAFKLWCWRRLFESSLDCKQIKPVNPKGNQPWVFTGRADVGADAPILWPPDAKSWLIGKKPWCWERLKAEREGGNRGQDDWMASPTQWTWIWVDSGSWWWIGRPGMLQYMGLQRVGRNWATELNWTNYQKEKLRKSHVQLYKKEKHT